MKIVKPIDWQFVPSASLDVFVEDIDHDDLECVLWTREDYFTASPQERRVLARTPLLVFNEKVAVARLENLQAWQSCVIGIVISGGTEELAVTGVNLSRSPFTHWLSDVSQIEKANVVKQILYPLPSASYEFSHQKGAEVVPVEIKQDMSEFLLSNDMLDPSALRLGSSREFNASETLRIEDCYGLEDPRVQHLLTKSAFKSSAPYIARFHKALAMIPAGVIITNQNKIWADSSVAAFFNDPALNHHPKMFRALGKDGIIKDGLRNESDILADNGLAKLPGMPLIICSTAYRNHAHWIMNSLLAVYFMQKEVCEKNVCLLVPSRDRYIIDTIQSLGISQESIIYAKPGTYSLDNVLFPSTLSTYSNRLPAAESAAMFVQMREFFSRKTNQTGPDKIYITRIGSGTQRKISNELALIAALEERGFTCVAPHELAFGEEVICFSNARVIIGQLGAGLVNIGFSKPGCLVIEIGSHNYTSNDFWFLSHILGHRFVRLMFPTDIEADQTLHDFTFEVPLDPMLVAVDRVLATL